MFLGLSSPRFVHRRASGVSHHAGWFSSTTYLPVGSGTEAIYLSRLRMLSIWRPCCQLTLRLKNARCLGTYLGSYRYRVPTYDSPRELFLGSVIPDVKSRRS